MSRMTQVRSKLINWPSFFRQLAGVLSVERTYWAGEVFTLTLYWRAERQSEVDYVAFIHLFDGTWNMVVQADGPPQGGLYPTSWWEPGDEIVDIRQVVLPADTEEGEHKLAVGLYRWETMERLPALDGEGKRHRRTKCRWNCQ